MKTKSKERLDVFLVETERVSSRDEAQRLIRAGLVYVDETVIDKPGTAIQQDRTIRIAGKTCPYVSRGGLKLEGALQQFQLDIKGWTAVDLGASTGGFTDCLLKHGVVRVYAVDVGHGQLAYTLQTDPRVVVMDRTNCRYLEKETFEEDIDLIVADLSFISLKTVFPAIHRIAKRDGYAILLIKPQFEIGKGRVGKGGIVKHTEDHIEVIQECINFMQNQQWMVCGLTPSPITGKTGNLEFLIWLQNRIDTTPYDRAMITGIVNEAHAKKHSSH